MEAGAQVRTGRLWRHSDEAEDEFRGTVGKVRCVVCFCARRGARDLGGGDLGWGGALVGGGEVGAGGTDGEGWSGRR